MSNISSSNVGKFKIVVKAEPRKIETIEFEIELSPNFWTEDRQIKNKTISWYYQGTFGSLLVEGVTPPFVEARANRIAKILELEFRRPEKGKCKDFEMLPFQIDLLAKDVVLCSLKKEFPVTNLRRNSYSGLDTYYQHSVKIPLLDHWKSNMDSIKITFNISVEEIPEALTVPLPIKANVGLTNSENEKTVRATMPNYFNSQFRSDVTICYNGKSYYAHQIVLSMASPLFRQMFETEMKEKIERPIDIEEMDEKTFHHMMTYIYTGKVAESEKNLDCEGIHSLFKAADRYQIAVLRELCATEIKGSLSINNALEVYEIGVNFEEQELLTSALEFIKKEKNRIFNENNSEEYWRLCPKLMREIFPQ